MTNILDKTQADQILTPPVRRIMQALAVAGEARVVGGAVRDALLKGKIGDIDLATTLPPERVMELLAGQGIKTVPTGLAHGTVTAVIDHIGYEITSLRRDVETDGRHAQVAFTNDWRIDAARRDFTFNALYLDADGKIYDFFGGGEDAQKGHIRFIGDAQTRIREDVLRILRFFRFTAFLGKGEPDGAALAACRELAALIPRLSAERVMREVIRLLSAPNPCVAWQLMDECGVTQQVLPEAASLSSLQTLLKNETANHEPPAALTRLAALLPPDAVVADTIATRLKFSNRDNDRLCAIVKATQNLRDQPLRPVIYAYGVDAVRAAIFLYGKNISESLAILAAWEKPVFPIRGEDIIASGVPAGAQIGTILRAVEKWWIEGDFRAGREGCLTQVEQHMKNH